MKRILTYHSINEFNLSIHWIVFPNNEGTSLNEGASLNESASQNKASSLIEAASVEEAVNQNETSLLIKDSWQMWLTHNMRLSQKTNNTVSINDDDQIKAPLGKNNKLGLTPKGSVRPNLDYQD